MRAKGSEYAVIRFESQFGEALARAARHDFIILIANRLLTRGDAIKRVTDGVEYRRLARGRFARNGKYSIWSEFWIGEIDRPFASQWIDILKT